MPSPSLFRRPAAFLPVVMSTAAALLVVEFLVRVGRVRQADEGAEAHLFQLLMVIQVPIIAWFAIKHLPTQPRQSLIVMSMQVLAGVGAMSMLYFLEH